MQFNIQYLQDSKGKPKAVQLSIRQWNSLLAQLSEFEFSKKFADDLRKGLTEVEAMNAGNKPKRTKIGRAHV